MNNQKAEQLKNKGNEEFKLGHYNEAISLYSKAYGNIIILTLLRPKSK